MKLLNSIAIALLVLLSIQIQAQDRPNILWINGDDLGAELGCYGNPDVYTPHMDKLASEGIRFTKAYSNAAVCSASRSSMITGMYPPSVNSHDHRTIDKTPLPQGIEPIVTYFQEAGYYCINGNARNPKVKGKGDYNFTNKIEYDDINWNTRAEGQPFFAQIQINDPHRTFHHDKEHPIDYKTVSMPKCYPDYPLLKADWAWYLESVQHADNYVGQILKRLEEEGLANNTIVILFGDHGRPHLRDKQFLYEGGIHIPLIVRYPDGKNAGTVDEQLISLIDVAASTLAMANIKQPKHMQGIDLLGKKPNKRKYIYAFRDRAGDAPDNIRSICDGQYKLIWNRMPNQPYMQLSSYKRLQYPAYTLYHEYYKSGKLKAPYTQFMASTRPEIELYDLNQDPNELNNLANKKDYANIKNKLFKKLESQMPKFEENRIAEAPETTLKAKKSSDAYLKTSLKKRGLDPNISDKDLLIYWEELLLK
ncbi:sulfatase family protein [Saccharicrinis aurantiacus]|uniref:sulfatase family protein n=1 Tax=Saccharicrinis aurantiacus TaxID=1849719 RepID=UPI002493A427|nr:sulfatase [Saccharicrinis aurantiacus]